MRSITDIIVHCSDTPPNWRKNQRTSTKVAEIKRWHVKERGWSDIGYHFIIDRDGTVAIGRPITRIGAHTKGRNKGSIGICLIGGKGSNSDDNFADHFTPEQENSLFELIDGLNEQHGGLLNFSGHNEHANRACPGFNVPAWFSDSQERKAAPVDEPSQTEIDDALSVLVAATRSKRRDGFGRRVRIK